MTVYQHLFYHNKGPDLVPLCQSRKPNMLWNLQSLPTLTRNLLTIQHGNKRNRETGFEWLLTHLLVPILLPPPSSVISIGKDRFSTTITLSSGFFKEVQSLFKVRFGAFSLMSDLLKIRRRQKHLTAALSPKAKRTQKRSTLNKDSCVFQPRYYSHNCCFSGSG